MLERVIEQSSVVSPVDEAYVTRTGKGQSLTSTAWIVGFGAAVIFACYVGFRLPNLWSVTLYNVSFSDGVIRRSLFGTVLEPIWNLGNHQYFWFALVAFAILAALLVVVITYALKSQLRVTRVVVLIWLLAPTGAYLFHEVGYLDQAIYLLLFLSIWAWKRVPVFVAVLPVAAAVCVHEIALFTVWPILLWWSFAQGTKRFQRLALLIPLIVGILVFLSKPLSAVDLDALHSRLTTVLAFEPRVDALALFGNNPAGSWSESTIIEGSAALLPYALAIVFMWIGIFIFSNISPRTEWYFAAGAIIASLSPLLIIVSGWDFWRWAFLALSNTAILLVFWFTKKNQEPSRSMIIAMFIPVILLSTYSLKYFDDYQPRTLNIREGLQEISSGTLFETPTR